VLLIKGGFQSGPRDFLCPNLQKPERRIPPVIHIQQFYI